MTSVKLRCRECGLEAKRQLLSESGSRGVHETSAEPALCPAGHGPMERVDGVSHPSYGHHNRIWPDK